MNGHLDRLTAALADRYAIEREIGTGGMAIVYLARDLKHHRRVALKVLRPELAASIGRERFFREIEIAASLSHPNILVLHDSGEAAGTFYYVMPFVEGESLRDRLTREHQLALDDALQIATEVADGLGCAHARGVIHRDIKPENILLESGHAVVSDFGIARPAGRTDGAPLTEAGLAVGTPAYMSPEQASGARDVDARSDLYALGCVLYEMLCGETPYTGPTPQAILAKKLTVPPPRMSVVRDAVSPRLEAVLAKALARAPADRFATAAQFIEALSRARNARPDVRSGRRTVRVMVGALGVTVLAVGGWWVATHTGGPAIRRLAVLPLANFTNDSSQAYFVQGVHDALISELQQAGVTVIGRTSVLRYQRSEKPVREIADELGVDAVIEGSVFRAGDSVEIAVRLIDGRSEASLWRKSYVGTMRSVSALYHGVTGSIARELQSRLSPETSARLAGARPVDPQAYDDYLQGQFHFQRLTPMDLEMALQYFQRALSRDSTDALAQAGIALVWDGRSQMGLVPPREAGAKASAAVRRALELDSTLAEVQYVAAVTLTWQDWNWEGAERAFRRAIEINPNHPDAHAFYSSFLYIMKRPAEARLHIAKALALDPLNPLFRAISGLNLLYERRYDAAITELQESLRLFPENPAGIGNLLSALFNGRKYPETIAAFRRMFPDDSGFQTALTRGHDEGGFRGGMRRAAEVLAARAGSKELLPFTVADAFALAGEKDRAIEWLELAYQAHDPNLPYIHQPDFDILQDEPRFRELIRRMRLPE